MSDFAFATQTEICLELANRLKQQRLASNLSQQELAARADVSLGTIRHLERAGQVTLESWVKVLMALGLVEALQPLFLATRPQSIAQMERDSRPPRARASRRSPPT
jgi:transcriptional regulator with XRE-family HTH domain